MNLPSLAYIAIASRDVESACRLFADGLGLDQTSLAAPAGEVPAFAVGDTAILIFAEDDPFLSVARPGVDHVALDVAEREAVCAKFERAIEEGRSVNGSTDLRIDPAETAGVAVRLTDDIALEFRQGAHVERVDHIGIASADNQAAEELYSEAFGCPVESRQTDMEVRTVVESFTSDRYGVVYHSRPPKPAGGLRVSFLTVGDTELEFLQEFDPNHGRDVSHGMPGTTRQDQGAIGRYIEKRGAGLHHIALKTGDIDRTLAHLASLGVPLIDSHGRPGSRRGRIGFVHPKALGGVLLHFVER